MKVYSLLLLAPLFCLSSDKSDRLPDVNRDNINNTNNITITNQLSPRNSPRPSKILHAGPKHPLVEAAHEEARRRKEEDDFITCCCFIKIKKIPLR